MTVERAVAASRGVRETWFAGDALYWIESRPDEAGRYVVMRRDGDAAVDVTPPGFNARTRVHEYGGGSYTVGDGTVVFSNFADGRLYTQPPSGEAQALTPAGALRYADLRIDPTRQRVLCVVEDHRADGAEPTNSIGAVSLRDGSLTTLVAGADFFSDPRPSPDGQRLAWLRWSRPNMPWDGCELWVGRLNADGAVEDVLQVAGGPDESIAQPAWAPDGSLVFISDRSGWWNLYRRRDGTAQHEALAPMEAEFADAQWVFNLSCYAILPDGRIVAVARHGGRDHVYLLNAGTASAGAASAGAASRELETPFTEIDGIVASGSLVAFVGGAPTRPAVVVTLDVEGGAMTEVRRASELPVDPAYLSIPRHVEFPTDDGRTAFAHFYAPTSPDVVGPAGERPPLVVVTHGGPTSHATTAFSPQVQFFATRGLAVVDVDYGGSTGYGREFRRRLNGQWGVVDLHDCTSVALWLADQGLVDRSRLAMRGGSAGGYTTLSVLAFGDVFAAGASYFGVGDLEALARDTHKFESRYLDIIVAPYPDEVEVYRERSPIHFVDRIRRPLLVLQGTDDMIVPRAQADDMVAALERNGIPHAYLLYEGEGHGFRRAENICRSLAAEISFYGQVFGFRPAGDVEPIEVRHLAEWKAKQPAQAASGGP